MKKLILTFGCVGALFLFQSSKIDPSNPPTGSTGAPGEQTCAKSGCHSGGTFTGTVAITGIPDTITANTNYTLTLTQTSNATRAGFQVTCLDASNTRCGTFAVGAGTNVTGTTRQYIRQSQAKLLSNGSVSWTFTWTSPATIPGNTCTFYFSSIAANGNNEKTGDNVLLNTKTVQLKQTSNLFDTPEVLPVTVFPNPASRMLFIEMQDYGVGTAEIFDLSGRKISTTKLMEKVSVIDVEGLDNGMYQVRITSDNKSATKQIIIKR